MKSDLTLIPDFIKDYPDAIEEMDPYFPSVFSWSRVVIPTPCGF